MALRRVWYNQSLENARRERWSKEQQMYEDGWNAGFSEGQRGEKL
jgi:hypothetical protein